MNNTLFILQHNHFVKYLEHKKYGKTMEIMRLIPTRLQMAWQTRGNGIDSAVFAMRHLETYTGGGARNWIPSLLLKV